MLLGFWNPSVKPTVHEVTLPQVQRLNCFSCSVSHQNSSTRQACSPTDCCLKYNYLKTSARCYRALVFLSSRALWNCSQEKNTLYYWSYLQLLYSGERGSTVVWNIFWIPKKYLIIDPIGEEDEWFSMHLKASEHRVCVEQCGLVLWPKIFGSEPHANIYLGTGSNLQMSPPESVRLSR